MPDRGDGLCKPSARGTQHSNACRRHGQTLLPVDHRLLIRGHGAGQEPALGKSVNVVVALPGSRGQSALDRGRPDLGGACVRVGRSLDQSGEVALEDALHDLDEVAQQVPAVGDLSRLGCT